METYNARDVRTFTGKFNHRCAAETIADGRDALDIYELVFLKHVERCPGDPGA